MTYIRSLPKNDGTLSNTTMLLWSFATAFFPRLFTYFGAPAILNFVHFGIVPIAAAITLWTSRVRDRRQVRVAQDLLWAMGILLGVMITSAIINQASIVNVFLYFMFLAEPMMLMAALMMVEMVGERLEKFRKWVVGFAFFNLFLVVVQSILMPIGIYPRRGGTLQDNIAGVFASGGGSAGNYVSATVSFYFALYFLQTFKNVPLWIRVSTILLSIYQLQVSDSKQTLATFLAGGVLLVITKLKRPGKFIGYLIVAVIVLYLLHWAYQNLQEVPFVQHIRNWTERDGLYAPDGEGTQTKLAAFRIIPTHYKSVLNVLFGLGPGHSVSRLGGWVLRDYESLLIPLGATVHPASAEVFRVVSDGWVAQQSTIFFPLFTWAGIWGDLGWLGLAAYLYMGWIVWSRVCVDDFGRFVVLSTVVLGFILTQMEEPGQMLTAACLLALRWHELRLERSRQLEKNMQAKSQSSLAL